MTDEQLAGVFLRRDVLAAGYDDKAIRRHVRSGEWHRIRPGAYSVGSLWASLDEVGRHRLTSRAVLANARVPVVLSHQSALAELDGVTWRLPLDEVNVTRRDRRCGRRERGVRQHCGSLVDGDVTTRSGVETTSASRTALDITTIAGVEVALCVVNDLLHRGQTSLAQLQERVEPMTHHPGSLTTGLVLSLADARIESVGESRLFYWCWRRGVPLPQPQVELRDQSGHVWARVDFAWPRHGVWLEFDGKQKYVTLLRAGESVTDVVLREKAREDRIREATGWRCIRVTWAELGDPAALEARIRRALAASADAA